MLAGRGDIISLAKKIICLSLLAGLLGIGLFFGGAYIHQVRAAAAAANAVDEAEALLADLADQESIDAAQAAWETAETLVKSLSDETVRDEQKERLAAIQSAILEAQEELDILTARMLAMEEAVAAVEQVQELLRQDITTQELIDAVQDAFAIACTLVGDLHAGPARTALTEQLAAIETDISEAQELYDAEQAALTALEETNALLDNLSSQSRVNAAKDALKALSVLAEALQEGAVKEELAASMEEIEAAIESAQQEIYRKAEAAATDAVEAAESLIDNLATQGAIDTAGKEFSAAKRVVDNLHSGSVKDALSARLQAVGAAIDQAQQQLDDQWAEVRLNFVSHYTYRELNQHLQKLTQHYPELASTRVVGNSILGQNIWAITVGTGGKKVLVTGALHASEWITTPVLMRTIETLLWEYSQEITVQGESVKQILDNYSITFIPMVNPDAVTLVQRGTEAFPDLADELTALNGPWSDFSRWKANIRGVDINRNFFINWEGQPAHENDPELEPSYAFYPGSSPESEPETRAVANWIRNNNPDLFLDYHSMGEILFWWYLQDDPQKERDRAIVRAMRDYSGYRMESIDNNANPSATSTYWGSSRGIPSITVELGSKSPRLLTMGDVPGMFARVRYLPLIGIINLPGY